MRSDIETATVIDTDGTLATVITDKSKSCNECGKAQAGICGKQGDGIVMEVNNSVGAEKGDTVKLGIENRIRFEGYFLIFILPVIILILSAYAGELIGRSFQVKGLDAAAGFTGLVTSISYALYKIHKLDKAARFQITDILGDPPLNETSSYPEEADYLRAFNKS
jgi:sigma-E factor negative regulatory protein RseC